MTLLLDAEARLFVIPGETRTEPEPSRPRQAAPPSDAAPPRDAARPRAAAQAAPAALPEPATWAGAGEQSRTLDDLLSASWDGLSAESAAVACPVCDGELVRRWSAGAGVVGGRCRDCGSELS
jgi:hypothetical protein